MSNTNAYGSHTDYYVATDAQLIALLDLLTDRDELVLVWREVQRRGIDHLAR
jgi:hypothetical protein